MCVPNADFTAAENTRIPLVPQNGGPGTCHREYLLSLSDMARSNIVEEEVETGRGSNYLEMRVNKYRANPYVEGSDNKPTQWAAMGFDRIVSVDKGIRDRGVTHYYTSYDLYARYPASRWEYGTYQYGSTLFASALGDHRWEIFNGEPLGQNKDVKWHTEKAMRSVFYDYTPVRPVTVTANTANGNTKFAYNINWATVQDVYVYSYSSPCFRGCTMEIS